MKLLAPVVALLIIASPLFAQTTMASELANNTSACGNLNDHCQASFPGMSDVASGTYNAPPLPVSLLDPHTIEYPSATTDIFVHFMPWFCMKPGSTATGPGTSCNSHLQVGYNSNDPVTVAAQMNDIAARGFRGPIIDWYGPTALIADATTSLIKNDLESRCVSSVCPMSFALNEDQGSITRSCPLNGAGADQTACILAVLESDLDYVNTAYFPSPAYLRVDNKAMKRSSFGKPVIFFFICEECFTNPAPHWTYIWNQLRAHVQAYTTGDPILWFIFRDSVGFSHTQTDGAFAWINHYGSNDPYGLAYLANFYDKSLKSPTLQPWGAAWKGFDNTNAPWNPPVLLTPQQCGNTWLKTFSEMKHNGDYSSSNQLPFLQVSTWNDYEEGSEIETGIDNCLALGTTIDPVNFNWIPLFSSTAGREATVDHYIIFGSVDGVALTQLASVPAGVHSIALTALDLSAGAQSLFVEAIGKPSIQNHLSPPVHYYPPVALSSVSPSTTPVTGGTAIVINGANFRTGTDIRTGTTVTIGGLAATVTSRTSTTITAITPTHSAGLADLTVTNPGGSSATLVSSLGYFAPPSFTIALSPTSKTVAQGGTASYAISVTPLNGFSGTVTFVATGLPTFMTATSSVTAIPYSEPIKFSVSTHNAAKGTYTITVVAASGTITTTSSTTLIVN